MNKVDSSGRSALHWATDNNDVEFSELLIAHQADVNSYNRAGQSVLVYPLLRNHTQLKRLLYRHGANLNFAQDFINTKLIGHRFELKHDVDILAPNNEFIEIDYEGFFLEFTLEILQDSLKRFRHHYSARHLREYFFTVDLIISAFKHASMLIKFQSNKLDTARYDQYIDALLDKPLLILPIAYRGHAMTFVKCGPLWAKCDRGENSQREPCVTIHYVNQPDALTKPFLKNLLYTRQTQRYIHEHINEILGLEPIATLPISSQVSGNCSWANVEATVAMAYFTHGLQLYLNQSSADLDALTKQTMYLYNEWSEWDKDRALYDCIHSFYKAKHPARRASKVSIMAGILFQSCNYGVEVDMTRAEKILKILSAKEYRYILNSYIETYIHRRLSKRGNNLIHLLEDAGINAGVRAHAYPSSYRGKS